MGIFLATHYTDSKYVDLHSLTEFDSVQEAVEIGMKFDDVSIKWKVLRELNIDYEVKNERKLILRREQQK